MKKIIESIGVLLGLLLSVVGYFFVKNKMADPALDNKKVLDSLNQDNTKIAANNTTITQQEVVQNQLKQDIKETENDNTEENPTDVTNFFNTRK